MKKSLLFLVLFITTNIIKGQNVLEIDDNFTSKDFYCYAFTDSTKKLTITEIKNSNFKKIYSADINFGATDYNHWIKVDIINKGKKTNSVILDCDIVYLDDFSYYIFTENKLIDKKDFIAFLTFSSSFNFPPL